MESGAFTVTGAPKVSQKVRSSVWPAALCYQVTLAKLTQGLD